MKLVKGKFGVIYCSCLWMEFAEVLDLMRREKYKLK